MPAREPLRIVNAGGERPCAGRRYGYGGINGDGTKVQLYGTRRWGGQAEPQVETCGAKVVELIAGGNSDFRSLADFWKPSIPPDRLENLSYGALSFRRGVWHTRKLNYLKRPSCKFTTHGQ